MTLTLSGARTTSYTKVKSVSFTEKTVTVTFLDSEDDLTVETITNDVSAITANLTV